MLSQRTPSRLLSLSLVILIVLGVVPFLPLSAAQGQHQSLVISQLYAGGQSSGAPLRADYIELFNPGAVPVTVDGWSVQYAAAAGTSWRGTTLSGKVPPGGHYLVWGAVGETGADLPPADAAGSLSLGTNGGRIALVASASPLTCGQDPACATAQDVIDFVGYGPQAASFEGTGPARAPGVERALLRTQACADADDNAADFRARLPMPRTLAAPTTPCDGSGGTPEPVGDEVRIADIQGRGHGSPLFGQEVINVPGVVTTVEGNRFWMQDPQPDGDDATSDGILVFTAAPPQVAPGTAVLVSGLVEEFPAAPGVLTTTEITEPAIQVVSLNQFDQIVPASLGSSGRMLPTEIIEDDAIGSFEPATDGLDFWESLEGMLVRVDDAIVTGPSPAPGVITVLAEAGRGATGLNPRGSIAIGETPTGTDFNPEVIYVSDDLIADGSTFAAVDAGARIDGSITGVVAYGFNHYRVLPTEPVTVTQGTLQRENAVPAGTGELAIATFNVENLDPADGPDKFAQLAEILVDNLASPDLVVLEEMQDNSGPVNDGTVAADLTARLLIEAITAVGGPDYEYRDIAPQDGKDGGEGGGNIRVGFLFRTDRGLSFVDRPGGDATTAVALLPGPQLSVSPGRIDPLNAAFNADEAEDFSGSRKPLVGEFTFNGHTILVIGNHFNSKGGDDPLYGFTQPPVLHSEPQRMAQARVVREFVDAVLTADPDAQVIVLGDLNDFQFSRPVKLLAMGATPAADLLVLSETLPETERYSYIFDGNAQALDQMLVSRAMEEAMVPGSYDIVHVNAEFADQVSDHDPQVARFLLP